MKKNKKTILLYNLLFNELIDSFTNGRNEYIKIYALTYQFLFNPNGKKDEIIYLKRYTDL